MSSAVMEAGCRSGRVFGCWKSEEQEAASKLAVGLPWPFCSRGTSCSEQHKLWEVNGDRVMTKKNPTAVCTTSPVSFINTCLPRIHANMEYTDAERAYLPGRQQQG